MSIEEIENSVQQLWLRLTGLGLLIMLLLAIGQYYFIKPLLQCLAELKVNFRKLAENPAQAADYSIDAGGKMEDVRQVYREFSNMVRQIEKHSRIITKNEEKYRQIAKASGDLIWEWDAQQQMTSWTGDAESFFGCVPSGANAHFEIDPDWVHHDDREKRVQALSDYLSRKTPFYLCKYRLINSDFNIEKVVLVRGSASFSTIGAVKNMVGSMVDITSYQELADSVGERFILSAEKVIGEYAVVIPGVGRNDYVSEVKRRMEQERWPGLVVLENEHPVGLVMRNSLDYLLSSHYGNSLYNRKPIASVMDENPLIVSWGMSLEEVAVLAGNRKDGKQYDLIVVADNGSYRGMISVMELLTQLSKLRIESAVHANPLTGLPGNLIIEQRLRQVVKTRRPFAALYIDLDNFKSYNDKYGFERGDAAIRLTATILVNSVVTTNQERAVFVGHIGGDDFLLLTEGRDQAIRLAEEIIADFDRQIKTMYTAEDCNNGFISATNRKGEIENIPIMSISIAIVDNAKDVIVNYLEIGEIAAQLKQIAKMKTGSIWVVDRRESSSR